MSCIHVTTQEQLDAALGDSERGACIHLDGDGTFVISSYGSASVRAYGSASVRAYGSASVEAYGSASVEAYGSASVRAYGSASVRAYGSASVEAYGSASVEAYGSASVEAYGSASVEAYGSASVHAWHTSTITARPYVAVHQHQLTATVTGGHIIIVPDLEGADTTTWLDYHGLQSDDGTVTLFKAVDDAFTTSRRFDYSPGATPEAPDWQPTHDCGTGLHFSPTPHHAREYYRDATRFMGCPVRVDEISVIDGSKVKARRVVAPGCVEVDAAGRPVKRESVDVKSAVAS